MNDEMDDLEIAQGKAANEVSAAILWAREARGRKPFESDRVQPDWEDAYSAVQDRLTMAVFFIHMAGESRPRIKPRWSLNIAAGALWSAFDIFNKKVLQVPVVPRTSPWFDEHEPLVNRIRHGGVHFQQSHGIGKLLDLSQAEPNKKRFLWVEGHGDIPFDDVLLRLKRVVDLLIDLIAETTIDNSEINFG